MAAAPEPVPVERAALESRDPEEVEEVLNRRYIGHRERILSDSAEFVFRSRAAAAAGLVVDEISYQAAVAIDTEPFEALLILDVHEGHIDLTAGRLHSRAGAGDAVVYPTGSPIGILLDRMTYRAILVPADALARAARRLDTEPADLRFERMTPTSAALSRRWSSTVDQLVRGFSGPQPAFAHPLLLAGALDIAADAALAIFPNTTMTADPGSGPGRVGPAVVRRAVEFIDAHADEPITTEDIAAAAGVDVRSLRSGFGRHRETSPTAYLRRVRLERARDDLRDGGDPTTTVAHRWGFATADRFTEEHHRSYGHPPG